MFPERIACLSAESADICTRLGASDRIVAVSAFAPPEIRRNHRMVSGFSRVKSEELLALKPDLVITFSDVQADMSADLIREHCTVLATNQRSLHEIGEAILLIGRAIGCAEEAERLAVDLAQKLGELRCEASPRPRVYFEEWDDPLISGIGWVSEAVELAGGLDIFAQPQAKASRERQVDPARVVSADPQVIFASWCGKPVDVSRIAQRTGWEAISAVRSGDVHEIDSDIILQPGPRVLEGIECMRAIIAAWRERRV